MKIAVVGTGYVGLVTGTCLAETGNDVTCVDCDRKKIDVLNRGHVPIYEPGLSELVTRNVAAGRLRFTTDLAAAAKKARLVFLAVGTPSADDGSVRSLGPLVGRRSACAASRPRLDRRLQEHGAGGHQRQGGRTPERALRPRRRRGQQSRVPQGRHGDRRLHEARPGGRRRPASGGDRRPPATCISPTCGPTSRFWPCRPKAPR